ncbi:MAG: glycerol-3-phosphate acyltransferase [Chloroflexota bacterium]|nr:glycerol-3-phosphate acyltransferase [Anaerolineales bacterium]MCB8967262.1 glycerol-3-phosphate acyltransferase [Ardenticatenaceae bacterium]
MVNIVYFIIAGLIGYICGAVPFGYLYVKAVKGINILDYGSGRTGGTNSLRAAGWKVGTLTGLSDVFKGFMGVTLTRWALSGTVNADLLPWILGVAGVMSVVGHNWSVFLNWRGGAGTGPNVGWATALWWPMFPIALVVMVLMLVGVGMASVASLTMAAIIPITFGILYIAGVTGYSGTIAYLVCGVAAASFVTWALRPNIKRLIEGNERVVGPRAKRKQQVNNAQS